MDPLKLVALLMHDVVLENIDLIELMHTSNGPTQIGCAQVKDRI